MEVFHFRPRFLRASLFQIIIWRKMDGLRIRKLMRGFFRKVRKIMGRTVDLLVFGI